MAVMEPESEYRRKIQTFFDRVQKVFDDVDPDLAECDQSQGAVVITFADSSRCILSAQPSVRQLWVALASRGTAYHFNLVQQKEKECWMDDKGKGLELVSFLEDYFKSQTGLQLNLQE